MGGDVDFVGGFGVGFPMWACCAARAKGRGASKRGTGNNGLIARRASNRSVLHGIREARTNRRELVPTCTSNRHG